MPSPPSAPGPLLLARGLSLQLGGRQILAGLDLALAPGQRLQVKGASGSGKSTLLRALAGLVRLEAGHLELEGRGFAEHGGPAWRRRVALVTQGAPVLPGTPDELARELRGYAVHRAGPWDPPEEIAARLGLDPPRWTRDWAKLSGGERQRAHLALALAGRPLVLLLDEPTSALDPEATARVEAELAGRTAVWVSHDPSLAGRLQPDAVLELS